MIRGELTNLRAVDRTDLDCIHSWLDDPDEMRSWGYGAPAPSRNQTIQSIERWLADEAMFGHPSALIIETLEREPIGLMVLSRISFIDRTCELSVVLDAPFRRRGFGSDALDTLLEAAFEQWGYHRVTAYSEEHNSDAHAFFARHGFVCEGRLRAARYQEGIWHDVLIFGRLRATLEEHP